MTKSDISKSAHNTLEVGSTPTGPTDRNPFRPSVYAYLGTVPSAGRTASNCGTVPHEGSRVARSQIPNYRLHKPSGQAVVTIRDASGVRRDVYLGPHGSPESRAEYARLIALAAAGAPAAPSNLAAPDPSVSEVLIAFMKWALTYYRTPGGNETSEVKSLRLSLIPVRELYGTTSATAFGPRALAAVRQQMISAGLCRTLVNKRIDRVKRVFKWAASEELIPVTVYQSLRTLAGLRAGRTEARESEPVKPVDSAHVTATLPHLGRHARTMVELQRVTGMRPGEVCRLSFAEVDRSGESWLYRLVQHKTRHRGKERVVPFGPKARAILTEFLRGNHPPPDGFAHIRPNDPDQRESRRVASDAYQEAGRDADAELLRDLERPVVFVAGCVVDPAAPLFSPAEAREDRYRSLRAARKSKVPPSQMNRRKKKPLRAAGRQYTPESYAHAIKFAAQRAGVPHWHANQLRHLYATEVRKVYGLEAAQVLLGHAKADVTQVYAERDLTLALRVAAAMG